MHTSGLVITVSDEPREAAQALHEVRAAGPFTLGEHLGLQWAATMETPDPQAAQRWHDWAVALPGMVTIEVVFVHWDEVENAHA